MEQQPIVLDDKQVRTLRTVTSLLILLLGLYVALKPAVVYAPTPKVILYFLISLVPAILFGVEAVTRFELRLPAFAFVTGGAFAACLGTLLVLTLLSKPDKQITVFQVVDEGGRPMPIDSPGAVHVPLTPKGDAVPHFVDQNTIVFIFPEEVGEAELQVWKDSGEDPYVGNVTYAGSTRSTLRLGKQLVQRRPE
jgi:hypothetical protein